MSQFDVVVVGRGAVGSAAALAFGLAGWRVGLVGPPEAQPAGPVGERAASGAPAVAGNDWDTRVYALSPASRALLAELGIWPSLASQRIAPVYDMRLFRVARDGRVASTPVHLQAYRGRVESLAWIVENRLLQQALDAAIDAAGGASRTPAPGRIVRIADVVTSLGLPDPEAATPTARRLAQLGLAGGGRLSASLVVAADGAASPLRALAGLDHVIRDLEQTAIVANFISARPHRDAAWQWFGPDGIVALLPLPSDDLAQADGQPPRGRVSLVWSLPAEQAARALAGGAAAIAERVRALSHDALGAFTPISAPAAFALRTVRCQQVVAPSFVLIGDAAHAVHPMAGQGMNLGFGDVRALMEQVLAGPRSVRPVAPDWLTLRRYARARREPVLAMQLALDGLGRAFGDLPGPLVGLRDLGWEFVARSPWLQRRMIAHAVS